MKKTKESPKDKRLKKFTDATQLKILHPNYESRVMIATIFDDMTPSELVTGRKCIGNEKFFNKVTEKWGIRPKYGITRKFIVFKNESRISISNEIFSYLKIDKKLPHSFENYNGLVNKEVKTSSSSKLLM